MDSSLTYWLEPQKCAVLVVDMQNDYRSPDGYLAQHGVDITLVGVIAPKIARLVTEARKVGVLIAFTQQTTLPDRLSDPPTRRHFMQILRPGLGAYPVRGSWGHAICDDLDVADGDLIVEKFRASAFFGTPLDMLLKANGRTTVLVCGTATEGCVESTVRDAANHDYLPMVIVDCITSSKKDLHESSLKVMTARYNGLTAADIIHHWSGTAPSETD
ncbi:MAG: isochorismatase family cysteine hydrolase [Rhodospirillales bacterium]